MEKIAILIPCYNEEKTIGNVVSDFRDQLPEAEIYVYDNSSTDGTAAEARKAGAIVRCERNRGKGNVVRSMYRDIEADVYVVVDGDGTYPPGKVHELIRPVADGEAEMTIGSRLHASSRSHFKRTHRIGNRIFVLLINLLFNVRMYDLLSGYMALGRHVVKDIPLRGSGFEIEAELVIRCLQQGCRIREVPVDLLPRHEGTRSKINIIRDGLVIFNTIVTLSHPFHGPDRRMQAPGIRKH